MTTAWTLTEDHNAFGNELKAGDTVYRCTQALYGAISPAGSGMTLDPLGGYPFFEVPNRLMVKEPS